MKAWIKFALGLSVAVAIGSSAAAQTQPRDPVTGLAIPLLSYERVVSFANGCRVIVPDTTDPSSYKSSYWYGGCRFGLVDGPGYFYYAGEYSTKTFTPLTYRYGHPAGALPVGQFTTLPRGPGRAVEETIAVSDMRRMNSDPDMKELVERNGKFAIPLIALQLLNGDTRQDYTMVRVMKNNCPTYDVPQRLAEPTVGVSLSSAEQKALLPICKNALARLKAEGADNFDNVDYGYYFVVFEEAQVSPRSGYSYGASTSDIATNVHLCPNPTSLIGCEAVWEPMQARFAARRDAIRASWARTMASDTADLRSRFAPLEAEFRRKIAARAARRSGGMKP